MHKLACVESAFQLRTQRTPQLGMNDVQTSSGYALFFSNTSATYHAVAKDKVANMLLAVRGRSGGSSCKKVAQDLSRDAAREQLKPLLETACARLASVLVRSFDIAVEQEQTTKSEP